MNLQEQVCSLELAKRLSELGVKQRSLFFWIGKESLKKDMMVFGIAYLARTFKEQDKFKEIYSAFTVAEMLSLLPSRLDIKQNEPFNHFRLRIEKCLLAPDAVFKENYLINYYCDTTEGGGENAWFVRKLSNNNFYSENLSDAAAMLLIYLVSNKFVELPK